MRTQRSTYIEGAFRFGPPTSLVGNHWPGGTTSRARCRRDAQSNAIAARRTRGARAADARVMSRLARHRRHGAADATRAPQLTTRPPRRKNTLDDDEKGVADKLSADDKEEIENTINEALDWLDENPEADKDEYTSKQKEVEAIANPIMRNVYQGAGGPGGGEEEEDYDFGDDEL